jgi:2-polyprenyl-3-methyl-5-hydroxy-6-metoxy-1,4-benzoquinol methylase
MSGGASLARYRWHSAAPSHAHAYLLPTVRRALAAGLERGARKRLFDLGCGNGSVARLFADEGWDVLGVDPSEEGMARARAAGSRARFEQASDGDDLAARYGTWPFVLCLEVVEHVYDPPRLAGRIHALLEPGGMAVISTPYHGYLKNLALSIVPGAWDRHWHPLRVGGHIKFWSEATLGELLRAAGFARVSFERVGRVLPLLAKSLVAVAHRG